MSANAATGVVELTVHGRWSTHLGIQVCDGIRACLAGHPPVLLVDLQDLGDPDAASMSLWLATRRAAMVKRPPVRLALCLPTTTLLHLRLRPFGSSSGGGGPDGPGQRHIGA
jgi:hypothetical protein